MYVGRVNITSNMARDNEKSGVLPNGGHGGEPRCYSVAEMGEDVLNLHDCGGLD